MLRSELASNLGILELRLALHDASGSPVAEETASGVVAELGVHSRETLATLVGVLGAPGDLVRGVRAPGLIELGAGSRTLSLLERDELARAWRELELHASLRDAHVGRAELLTKAGRHEEARAAFREALALDPEDPALHEALAADAALPARERAEHWMQAGRLRVARFEAAAEVHRELVRISRPSPA